MLNVTRSLGESLIFEDLQIEICVSQLTDRQVTLGVTAPSAMAVRLGRSDSPIGINLQRSAADRTHANRDHLHTANLALHALKQQMARQEKVNEQLVDLALEQIEKIAALSDAIQADPIINHVESPGASRSEDVEQP